MLFMPHNILFYSLFIGVFLAIAILIAKFWVIPARGFIQLIIFTFSEWAFVCNKGIPCSNCLLSFGICPIGTIQRIAFIPSFPFYIVLFLVAVTGLIFGSLFCAWACPVGFVQDILQVPRLTKIKIDNKLNIIRYFILVLVIVSTLLELRFNFLTKKGIEIFQETTIIVGGIFLISAIFIKRPICRIFCPLGLIYGKLNKVSPIKVVLDKEKCLACGRCAKACVSDIEPTTQVNQDLCVKCFNCLKICNFRQK